MAEIDNMHIDSALAAERCIEGGTCKLSKLPKAKMPSKNTCADELSVGTCAVTKDFTAHKQEVRSGAPGEVVSHNISDKTAERKALPTQLEAAA